MRKIWKISWCLLLATVPLAGWGQNGDTLQVNLQKAVDIALSDNPTIRIADKEIERVDYSKKSAWYGLLPSLEGTAQYSKYLVPASMNLAGMTIDMPTDFNVSLGATLSLPLIVPALWRSIQMTNLDMQLAVEKARASKITLRSDVAKAYYNILLAQDSYNALQGGYRIAKQNCDEAKRRFDVGLGAEYDYISAEVQMQNLRPTLLQVENGITQAKQYLKVLMGVNLAVEVAVEGNLADFEASIAGRDNNRQIALNNNTDLVQLGIQQKQLSKALQLQRAQVLPMLAAFGSYNYSGTGNKAMQSFFTQQMQPASTEWYGQGLIVGLQLSVPITAIFTNTAKDKQLKIQADALTLQRSYLEDALTLQARTALDNMDKAVKQVDAAKKGVTLAEKGYSISTKRYETGAGTMLELQSASQALTQARLSYHQAIADYLTAQTDYEKLISSNQ
jgi:outer membrane protein TolC